MPHQNISKTAIKRLPVYLRILDQLIRRDVTLISSRELSNESGFTAEQIRKDLAYFGAFGTRGAGYDTAFLRDKIIKIIGLDVKTNVIVIGAGNLGTALTRYNTAKNPYVRIVAVFDNAPDLIDQKIEEINIMPLDKLSEVVKKHDVKVSIITVPADAAQQTTDLVVSNGIKAILNFAPAKLNVPSDVHVHNADLTIELQSLIYYSSAEEERLARLKHEAKVKKTPKTFTIE